MESTPRNGTNNERGFIALTSALILSALLMTLMFSTGASSFYARFDALNSEYKRVSVGLSEACSNAALLKIAQNYNYTPPPGGETVTVGSNPCRIVSVVYSNRIYDPLGNEIRKTATILTNAQYPQQNGSWSTHQVVATVQNPSYTQVSPPTCGFVANTNSINSGQSVTFTWSTAGSATQFKIDRDMGGVVTTIYSNSGSAGTLPDSPTASATYTATITGPGGSTQCQSPQAVTVQPSLAECADTAMMLSRSMQPGDLTQEQNAANALLDLYANATPHPQASVGSYTGLNGSPGQVPTSGQLTTSYATLYTTIGLMTKTNGTDVSAGMTAAANELNSVRHVGGRAKVLILVSPTGGHSSDVQAALSVADTAKLSGIEIFTLDFGDSGTLDDWAKLASGTFVYPGHQPGAHNEAANANNQASVSAENSDGDDFFVVPNSDSSAIVDLFKTIAEKVCPATIPPPPPAPPPPPPPPPAPGEPLLIGSWDEIINIVP